jgi:hypothetical protein
MVNQLEDALYKNHGHTRAADTVPFVPAEMTFTCGIGTIKYFHYSEKRNYQLTDFSLGDGGNGGEPITLDSKRTSYGGAAFGWIRDLAARWAFSGIQRVAFAMLKIRLLPEQPLFPHSMIEWLMRVRAANTTILREIVVVGRVMNSLQSDICPGALPRWSVLHRFVTAPQQLNNYYSRSILAGEALTRLAGELDLGSVVARCARLLEQDEDNDLLEESTAVIDALINPPAASESRKNLKCLTTLFLFDGDILTDDRRLRLIRSEMTLRMAASLARRSIAVSRELGDERPNAIDLRSCHELMHKYARLSEFVRLSNIYFGTLHYVSNDLSILEDLGDVEPTYRGQVGCLVSGLTEFGTSSTSLVYLMTSSAQAPSDSESMVDLRGRLISLASEILADEAGLPR